MKTLTEMPDVLTGSFWGMKLKDAEARGSFTYEDRSLAGDWQTCMCGQQDSRIPRDAYGRPHDYELRHAGLYFEDAVQEDDFDGARVLMRRIEARSAEILAVGGSCTQER